MEPLKCNVCGDEAKGVASSSLGAVSFAYCGGCLIEGAEPYGMLVGTIAMCGGLDEVAEWVRDCIEPTLRRSGKTREQFDADLAREIEEELKRDYR